MDREELYRQYHESRKDPKVFAGPMVKCPDCEVRRNQWHKEDCTWSIWKK